MTSLIFGLVLLIIAVISVGVMLREYVDELAYWIFAISCFAIIIIGATFTFHGLGTLFAVT